MSVSDAPRRILADDPNLAGVLSLIRTSFAYMEGRIDPPSSMHRLTMETVHQQATEGEIWAIGAQPDAVIFLTPHPGCLYLGKLAVAEARRGSGLARQLVELAEARAQEMGLDALELQTRVELVENHATFARMGFVKTGETAHPGYDRATSITMRKRLG
ncbi:N-acetyltransferase [Ruegeria sp. HKCCD8929]|uniref:GNAT family N-acetyltransferase n=1 Tax=Ruegeria sp. HKCCD8929 TaxID=2683006 RepID=UPI0014879244|nr:GNAT family N-acetyltransferase [Ruegeria sp. HKCCD8929]